MDLSVIAELRDPHTGFSVSHFSPPPPRVLYCSLLGGVYPAQNADRSDWQGPCSQAFEDDWEEAMLKVNIEKIGSVAVIHCEGRVVQNAAAFRLRDIVTQQKEARVILLDLSDVQALESGGLGMLVFLQRWASDHGIQFKVFDPPAFVRQRLERVRSASELEIAGMSEVLSLLGWEPKELWEGIRRAA